MRSNERQALAAAGRAALRLDTVAEGVESWEAALFLHAAGVDCGQGWHWSKAVAARDTASMLERGFPLTQHRRFSSRQS